MKCTPLILASLTLFYACKKHDKTNDIPTGDSNVHPWSKNVLFQEQMAPYTDGFFQHVLGYWPSKDDPNTQIMILGHGFQESGTNAGFRIASINKNTGQVGLIKAYDLDPKFWIQFTSCATMDNDGNTWVARLLAGYTAQWGFGPSCQGAGRTEGIPDNEWRPVRLVDNGSLYEAFYRR
ncbi:MAG TPA: hypothetical protein VI233_09890 [Puia sp.]